MAAIARDLVRFSDEIHDEAERMADAERRFSERRGAQAKQRAR